MRHPDKFISSGFQCSALFIVAMVALSFSSMPSPAMAAESSSFFKLKGLSAFASLTGNSDSIVTFVDIIPSKSVELQEQDGGPTTEAAVHISIYRAEVKQVCDEFGECFNEEIPIINIFDSVPITSSAFQIKPDLSKAALNTEISAFDSVSGTEKTVTINGEWIAVGRIQNDGFKSYFSNTDPPCISGQQGRTSFRDGDVSGSMTVDGNRFDLDELDEYNAALFSNKNFLVLQTAQCFRH
jgi:hypothetical protein